MRWQGRKTSSNIEDRRRGGGSSGGRARTAGIGGGAAIVVLLLGLAFGVDVTPLLSGGGVQSPAPTAQSGPNQIDDRTEEFVAVVLHDTETYWNEVFAASNLQYPEPTLVMYSGVTSSACGTANAAMGPFYCPGNQRIFLDTDFFRVMDTQLGAKGDFAKAYVIAHEVAHHVQNALGTLGEVNALRARTSEAQSNALSVRIELQADCYSGLWARFAGERLGTLEAGDIDEALNTAARIGDDALQAAAGRAVMPDSFTHGSSDQRQRWFYRGYETGDPGSCDTFAAREL